VQAARVKPALLSSFVEFYGSYLHLHISATWKLQRHPIKPRLQGGEFVIRDGDQSSARAERPVAYQARGQLWLDPRLFHRTPVTIAKAVPVDGGGRRPELDSLIIFPTTANHFHGPLATRWHCSYQTQLCDVSACA